VVFDRKDRLQDDYARKVTRRRLAAPRHHVPSSADYAEAVRLGLGWGMLPRQQHQRWVDSGELVVVDPARHVDVTLFWQQWSLRTLALDAIAEAVTRAARAELD